jgi:hypothetical protein
MYFAQVSHPTGKSHWTVVVEFAADASPEQIDPAMAALVQAARRVFPRKQHTELLPASTALGKAVAGTGERFYPATK